MKNIRTLVDSNLVERLNHVDDLTKIIFKAAGLEQKKNLMWVIRERRTLTVFTHDNLLATRIRLEQKQIIHYLKDNSALLIDHIKVRMAMPETTRRKRKVTPYQLSRENVRTLVSIAEGIEDEALREGLLRIARSGNGNDQ